MTTRQVILAALLLALCCCAIMWWLEGFRQEKMVQAFKAQLANLPTAPEGGQ